MATGRVPTTANSPLTAKGDLFGYSTTQARVAVGSDGDTLVADSSATTGLRWQASQTAGKNLIINGAFDFWQRGTSIATSTYNYTADRWMAYRYEPMTTSRQLTNDTTNLPNIQYCARVQRDNGATTTGALYLTYSSENADSARLSGKYVTLSFWARKGANFSAASNILTSYMVVGTGSSDANVILSYTGATTIATTNHTLTSTWQRFTSTGLLGAGYPQFGIEFAYTPTGTAGANDYFEVTGVQVELGNVATAFSRAGGTIQGELAMAMRYYERLSATANGQSFATGFNESTTISVTHIPFKVPKRIAPTALEQSGTASDYKIAHAATTTTCSAVPVFANASTFSADVSFTVASGLTTGQGIKAVALTGNAYLGWSAEL